MKAYNNNKLKTRLSASDFRIPPVTNNKEEGVRVESLTEDILELPYLQQAMELMPDGNPDGCFYKELLHEYLTTNDIKDWYQDEVLRLHSLTKYLELRVEELTDILKDE